MPNYTALSEYYFEDVNTSEEGRNILVSDETIYNYYVSIINCKVKAYDEAQEQ